MRPTITEQLTGMARTLAEVVTPHVDDAYAAEQLDHIVVALGQVAASWPTMLHRLVADNAELVELLRAGANVASPEADLSDPPPPPPDLEEVLRQNEALRADLDRLVRALAAAEPSDDRDALRATIRDHLRASVARFSQ